MEEANEHRATEESESSAGFGRPFGKPFEATSEAVEGAAAGYEAARCGTMRAGDPLATWNPNEVTTQQPAGHEGIMRVGDPVGGLTGEQLPDESTSHTV